MSNDFTFGLHGAIEPNITFIGGEAIEVMRLDKNGVTINPEMPLDEAAQHVINALDAHIKNLIQAERKACAKVCEETAQRLFEEGKQYEAHGADICADMIRAQNSKETT